MARRFVRSVRSRYADIPMIAADQNGPSEERTRFYRDHGVRMLWLPPDCGLSFARNRAVEQVSTPYVLLADDDFIFPDATKLEAPLDIMEQTRRLGFLGGRLVDIRATRAGEDHRFLRRWEKFLIPLKELSTLVSIPIDYLPLQTLTAANQKIYLCDMPMNWGLLRRAVFNDQLRWDEKIKINGEHEDFFLNLKLNSSWIAGFFPGLICDHQSHQNSTYQPLRNRQQGRQIFAEKWGFTHHLELGVGLRHYSDYRAYESIPVPHPELNEVAGEPGLSEAPPPVKKPPGHDA